MRRNAEPEDLNSLANKDDQIVCPSCGVASKVHEWQLVEEAVSCEICGEHDGLECPRCNTICDKILDNFEIL